ncbi:MAG: FkbM family methyltransferase [Inquilinus sp.]|nr:FkbM family methyltransferase [Inquilinus sp.]
MSGSGPASKESRNLATLLAHHRIDLVFDVGANIGQYARRLRRAGYAGRIVSFEPQAAAHAALAGAAAGDPGWDVAPRVAVGDSDRPVTLNISAESDMSSALPFTAEMAELLDSAAYSGTETVPQARLDALFDDHARPGDRVLLKSDTQGYDRQVLDGAAGVFDSVAAIQLELSIVPVYVGEPSWREMIDHLETLGFHPALFIPGYFNRRTARLIAMDGVFVRPAP